MKLRDFIEKELMEEDLPRWVWWLLFIIALWT